MLECAMCELCYGKQKYTKIDMYISSVKPMGYGVRRLRTCLKINLKYNAAIIRVKIKINITILNRTLITYVHKYCSKSTCTKVHN